MQVPFNTIIFQRSKGSMNWRFPRSNSNPGIKLAEIENITQYLLK